MAVDLTERMMGLHTKLDERFFVHQQALLDRDFVRAAGLLASYRQLLWRHMHDEETLFLPRYEAVGGDATEAPVKLFLGEHKNMRAFVDDFGTRTARLVQRADDHALLELLDRQATFKNLLLHHDLRERNALYPLLAQKLSEAEQEQLLAARSWSGA